MGHTLDWSRASRARLRDRDRATQRAKELATAKPMRAKFESTCPVCSEAIHKGEPIGRALPSRSVAHVRCTTRRTTP